MPWSLKLAAEPTSIRTAIAPNVADDVHPEARRYPTAAGPMMAPMRPIPSAQPNPVERNATG